MQTIATYSAKEFFYDQGFYDYTFFSNIPYKTTLQTDEVEFASLLHYLFHIKPNGSLYQGSEIMELLPCLKSFPAFKNCEIHILQTPVFCYYNVNRDSLNVEMEFKTVQQYVTKTNKKFMGENFNFSGTLYLYSLQTYQDQESYYLVVRCYEKV